MKYELAKKLKDAGFPQKNPVYVGGRIPNEEFLSSPKLDELIEACGDKFGSLEKINCGWRAKSYSCLYNKSGEFNKDDIMTLEQTPIEAVSYLYLGLNI